MQMTAGTANPPRRDPGVETSLQAPVESSVELSPDGQIERRRRKLEDARTKLDAAWRKFSSKLPPDQRVEVGREPDLEILLRVVERKNTKYQEKRTSTKSGKTQKAFANVVLWLHDHRDLLSIIPSDDKYVSVIAGSVLIISKATVNHENTAQVISESFDDLHEDLDYWKRQMTVHRSNTNMQYFVIEIYVIIFDMLTDIFTKWLTSWRSRITNSLNPAWLKDHILDKRARINLLRSRLESEAKLDTENKINMLIAHLQTLLQPSLLTVDLQVPNNEMCETLGNRILNNEMRDNKTPDTTVTSLAARPFIVTSQQRLILPDKTPSQLHQIAEKRTIKTIESISDIKPVPQTFHPIMADYQSTIVVSDELYAELEAWLKSTTSKAIWLEGSHDIEIPSYNTTICSTLVATTISASIPVIHYLPHEREPGVPQAFSPQAMLSTITYSLIQQLRPLLDPGAYDLGELDTRIKGLNTDKSEITPMLDILQEMIALRPPMVICCIDNIQFAEDPSNTQLQKDLHRFLRMLLPETQTQPAEFEIGIWKTCFTTDGFSGMLGDMACAELLDKIMNETSEVDELDSGRDLDDLW